MNLEKYGFRNGLNTLPGIDITIDLGPNQYFRDDGVVNCLINHYDYLERELGWLTEDKDKEFLSKLWGVCYNVKANETNLEGKVIRQIELMLMAVKKTTPQGIRFIKGHEATHLLIHSKNGIYLTRELYKCGFNIDPFERYTDEELIAHVGGLLALHKVNLLKDAHNFIYSHPEQILPLIEDLKQSKKS